jgi:hypothetical protein
MEIASANTDEKPRIKIVSTESWPPIPPATTAKVVIIPGRRQERGLIGGGIYIVIGGAAWQRGKKEIKMRECVSKSFWLGGVEYWAMWHRSSVRYENFL